MSRQSLLVSFVLLTFCVFTSNAQKNTWKVLSEVKYETKMDPTNKYEITFPSFSASIKKLEGQLISLKGYIIPLEATKDQDYFILSQLPFNLCYFCGGAGPETIAEVYTTEPIDFTESMITITGTLELNADDPEHMMYVLKDAALEYND